MTNLIKKNKIIQILLPGVFFLCLGTAQCADRKNYQIDLIIFSYNRPLQLYALLESIFKYVSGVNKIYVVFRASNTDYARAYDIVKQQFNSVVFFKQGKRPKKDFKRITIKCLVASCADYIMFAVDDMIVTDVIQIDQCIRLLEKTGAYGFYFRMGKNIIYSYLRNKKLKVPECKYVDGDVLWWRFMNGSKNTAWCYPNTVDMTLYRKQDVQRRFNSMSFTSPNTLEGRWNSKRYLSIDIKKTGLCFAHSKTVNIPLNLVQKNWHTRNTQLYSPRELLDKFNQGYKIDIEKFFKINNNSTHMPYEPTFIAR